MELLKTLIWIVNLVSALSVIVLVLMQHGKGADMGAAFGSGASGSLFGATGSANFLSRTTAICAFVFFSTSLSLVLLSNKQNEGHLGLMSKPVEVQAVPAAPAGGSGSVSVPEKENKIPD